MYPGSIAVRSDRQADLGQVNPHDDSPCRRLSLSYDPSSRLSATIKGPVGLIPTHGTQVNIRRACRGKCADSHPNKSLQGGRIAFPVASSSSSVSEMVHVTSTKDQFWAGNPLEVPNV